MKSYYVPEVDAKEIFGMVGRCGGGYNTMWSDWSPKGRRVRELIMAEFEEGINAINGHYEKLEKSMLEEGVRNPTIITCGRPIRRNMAHLPPEMRGWDPMNLLLCEGVTGGSRLYIAQKHNIPLPCIINDNTTRFGKCVTAVNIRSVERALDFYKDKPKLQLTAKQGVQEEANTAIPSHLDEIIPEEMLIKQRGKMWLDIMDKHDYPIKLSRAITLMIYGK